MTFDFTAMGYTHRFFYVALSGLALLSTFDLHLTPYDLRLSTYDLRLILKNKFFKLHLPS